MAAPIALLDRSEAHRLALLGVLAALLLGPRLTGPLLEPEEARYAEIPRQMLARGDGIIPTYEGLPYLDKPPLLYWLVMAAYRLLGVATFSARLVPVAVVLVTVAVVYLWGRRAAGPDAAFASAAVLLLTPDFLYRAPMLTMNGLLALGVTAACAAAHAAMLRPDGGRGWWLLAGLACGLGVLTKGLVALVLIVGPVAVWPLLDHRLRRPGLLDGLAFLLACSLVAGPWLIAIALRQPGFVEYFLWKHHVQRYLDPFDHARPWWDYLPQLLAGSLPWVLLVGPVLRRPGRVGGAVRVFLATAVAGLAFFSLAGSKRPVYLVPVYPPLALALGTFLAGALRQASDTPPPGWAWWRRPAVVTGLGAAVGAVLVAGTLLLDGWYAPRFSTQGLVGGDFGRASAAGRPVFSYPRVWDSTRFALQRSDVRAFAAGDRPALYEALRGAGPSLLVVRSGRDLAELLAEWPADLAFEPGQAGPFATTGLVRPRDATASRGTPFAAQSSRNSGSNPDEGRTDHDRTARQGSAD